MESFLLQSRARDDGQTGSQLSLSRLNGEAWLPDPVGSQRIAPWSCGADSASQVRDFFLQTGVVSQRFSEIARCLWDSVNLPAFDPVWGDAFRGNKPFRLYLDLDKDLDVLPWEMLGRKFAQCTILRQARWAMAAEELVWPLRVMIVVGASDTDPAVKANAEVNAIRRAVREVDRSIFLKILWRPEPDELLREIKEFCPHVLHFIGHGGRAVEHPDEPSLKFDLPSPRAWDWTPTLVEAMLHEFEQSTHCRIRMVFLNACRTAKKAPSSDDLENAQSLSATFLKYAHCVIAMQSDIEGTVAGVIAEQIYKRLAAGEPVDAALEWGRGQVKVQPGAYIDRREPFVASLTVTGPPEQVMLVPPLDQIRSTSIQRTKAFEIVREFVGREDKRLEVFRCLEPPCRQATPHTLFIVKGPESNPVLPFPPGKTWFVNWCMEACVRHGYDVRWTPVAGERAGLVDLMRAIRDGDTKQNLSMLHRRLDPVAFRDFNHALNLLLAHKFPMPLEPGTNEVEDEKLPVEPSLLNDEHFLEKVCTSFRSALMRAAGNSPLLFVLDDFARGTVVLPLPDFQIFLNRVLLPLADDERHRVRAILVLTDSQFRDYGLPDLPSALYKSVDLQDLSPGDFPKIAWEYLERTQPTYLEDEEFARKFLRKATDKMPGAWRIPYLKQYAEDLRKVL